MALNLASAHLTQLTLSVDQQHVHMYIQITDLKGYMYARMMRKKTLCHKKNRAVDHVF